MRCVGVKMPALTTKVWGSEEVIVNAAYCVKRMVLRAGYRCSIHYHRQKDEVFYVVKGRMRVETVPVLWAWITDPGTNGPGGASPYCQEPEVRDLGPGQHVHVPPMTLHRFTGLTDCEFLECSTHDDAEDSCRLTESERVS